MSSQEVEHALELRIRQSNTGSRDFDVEVCVVKKGPRAYKSVSLMTFSDPTTGEVKKRELRAQTWRAAASGYGYDFTESENRWHCENQEIDALRAFLNGELQEEGGYKIVRGGSDFARLLDQVERHEIAAADLSKFVGVAAKAPGFVESLAASKDGKLLVEAVELHRRREQLAALRAKVEDPFSTEHDLHRQLKALGWIFGGRYVGEAVRRQLTTEDVLDIPLVRADGALHVVELKQATIPGLFVEHRGHVIVGKAVHEAVGQAANYLRSLDEERHAILAKHGVDCRRASATVIIGNPMLNKEAIPERDMTEALRTYNSHLSRIEVITYAELVDDADRALPFVSTPPLDEPDLDEPDPVDYFPEPDPRPWLDEPPF